MLNSYSENTDWTQRLEIFSDFLNPWMAKKFLFEKVINETRLTTYFWWGLMLPGKGNGVCWFASSQNTFETCYNPPEMPCHWPIVGTHVRSEQLFIGQFHHWAIDSYPQRKENQVKKMPLKINSEYLHCWQKNFKKLRRNSGHIECVSQGP